MNLKEIREKAKSLGVKNYSKMKKAELIKAIQQQEGNSPCYQEITDCRQYDCCWMEDCQKSPGGN
uniref:Rho termination factor-like N-terminal domain-containing protein n=1 Tax=Desulfobacca acetoxidans TaxID=60893 RepID=A0A7C5EQ78_9BACT